jgi:Protein of unknown function (DUF3106)
MNISFGGFLRCVVIAVVTVSGGLAQAQGNTSTSNALFSMPSFNFNLGPSTNAQLAWEKLTPQQRKTLAPLAGLWDELDEIRKKKWLAIAERYARLKPDQQAKLQARMVEWASMSVEQRRKAREQFAVIKTVPSETKSQAWASYLQLSETERKQLADRELARQKPNIVTAPSHGPAPLAKEAQKVVVPGSSKRTQPIISASHPIVAASMVEPASAVTPLSVAPPVPLSASALLPTL